MAKVIKDAQNNAQDFVDNVSREASSAADSISNAVGDVAYLNPLMQALDSSRIINDVNRFGQDITGVTARNAADKAAAAAEAADRESELNSRWRQRLDENTAEFKKKRADQKQKQLFASGRAGTLMNGTSGYGSSETLGGAGSGKTLLGK